MAVTVSREAALLGATLRSLRAPLVSLALISAAINLLYLVVPLYSLELFDRVISSRSIDTLVWLTVIAAGLLMLQGAIDGLRGHALQRIGLSVEANLAGPLMRRSLVEAARTGRSTGQLLGDLALLRQAIGTPQIYALLDLPWAPIFLVVLFALHIDLGVFGLICLALLLGLGAIQATALNRAEKASLKATQRAGSELVESLRGAEAIRAMGMTSRVALRWMGFNREILASQEQTGRRAATVNALTKALRLMMQAAIMTLCVILVLDHEVTGGAIIAASIALARALAPIELAVAYWKGWAGALAAFRDLRAAVAQPVDEMRELVQLPEPRGELTARGLVYETPSGHRILKGLSFALQPASSLGIVGPSGAGKSTLARLLVNIVPASAGELRLDGAIYNQWDADLLGQHIGYLPQDVQLLPGTIAENIRRFGPVDDEGVIAAARLAGMHEAVLALPQGYATVIGARGVMLSGGQQQRIGLARALYGRPRLLVLDEPNAHLDPAGELALAEALASASAWGATIIVISHRSALLNHVDWIMVMRDGIIEAAGSRQEMLAKLAGAAAAPAGAEALPARGSERRIERQEVAR